jgi:hypothetical protein
MAFAFFIVLLAPLIGATQAAAQERPQFVA